MKKVIIVHRWSGGPEDDWRPWLKGELEKLGCQVLAPAMPDTEEPEIGKWVGNLAGVVNGAGGPDEETYFVGHSIGCQTILRYLETLPAGKLVGGAIFVAGWFKLENLEDEETAAVAKPWLETPIDLNKVKNILPKSTLFISDNDPFDRFEENK